MSGRLADKTALITNLPTGGEVRQSLPATARFHSQRGYGAVRISVPRRLLDELGADSLAIEVGPPVEGFRYFWYTFCNQSDQLTRT